MLTLSADALVEWQRSAQARHGWLDSLAADPSRGHDDTQGRHEAAPAERAVVRRVAAGQGRAPAQRPGLTVTAGWLSSLLSISAADIGDHAAAPEWRKRGAGPLRRWAGSRLAPPRSASTRFRVPMIPRTRRRLPAGEEIPGCGRDNSPPDRDGVQPAVRDAGESAD